MKMHSVRVYPSKEKLPHEQQLAWKMAEVATDPVAVTPAATEMVINRIIDNAAVAVASLNRPPVKAARAMALAHPATASHSAASANITAASAAGASQGATLFGLPNQQKFSCEWAAWANGTAVRELDYHDTFLAADYSHPGDNIPPILAVAQQKKCSGHELLRGLVTGYEIQVNLVKAICLHKYKKDHIAHLCPATAAGLGTLLKMPTATVYQAIQQAVHVSFTTRQSRKGEISSWKAFAPAHSGKLAIEACDRALRGEGSPSPIYEGEDSVLAYMLGGSQDHYQVPLPELGQAKAAILETYTKEHSAEYQSQALIDLAFRMRTRIKDFSQIKEIVIHTSHHTHYVIGTGAGDPQKMDPKASRETLDHSIMYIFTVALQDGQWHHVQSYAPERAQRPDTVSLWHKIRTLEEPQWTQWYHESDPNKKRFGGRVEIILNNGEKIVDELGVANAHPAGAKPFARPDYIRKFDTLTAGVVTLAERNRFIELVQRLPQLSAEEVGQLNVQVALENLHNHQRDDKGIF